MRRPYTAFRLRYIISVQATGRVGGKRTGSCRHLRVAGHRGQLVPGTGILGLEREDWNPRYAD